MIGKIIYRSPNVVVEITSGFFSHNLGDKIVSNNSTLALFKLLIYITFGAQKKQPNQIYPFIFLSFNSGLELY